MGHSLLSLSEAQIAREGIGRKFQRPTVFEDQSVRDNLRVALKKPRGPFSALFDRVGPTDRARIEEIAGEIGLPTIWTARRASSATGRSSGWRSGCCWRRTRASCWSTNPPPGMTTEERNHTADLLKRLAKTHAVVVVEHDMEFVRRLDCR
jgi:urea transport system ATP-binding protein